MPASDATESQINKVREIAGEIDYDLVAGIIAGWNDGQWDRALELITAWDAEYEPGAPGISVRGGRDGVHYLPTEAGNDIRSRMRMLLGLPEFRDSSLTGMPSTQAIPVVVVF